MGNFVKRTISLYKKNFIVDIFAKIRFWDAPYVEVEKMVSKKGMIVDLGCGEGIFSNYLAMSSSRRKIVGVDIDRKRISNADKGLKNVQFRVGDVTKVKIPECNAILMFHLLHHLSSQKAQEKLIKCVVKKIKKGGRLVIVEVSKKPLLKFLLSWFTDHFIVAWFFERKIYEKNIFFRTEDDWLSLFNGLNLKTKRYTKSRGKPFSHVVFVLTK
ncbi:MAG: class I SAM-dependent methyltransferase [bacterium]